MMVWAWAAEMMCRWAGVVPSPFVVFMVAAAELSVRRLRVVLRMVVRKRIFEWKGGRVVKDRALSIVGNLQFKMWVRETWTMVGDLKFPVLFFSLELALPSRRVLHYLY